MNLRDGACLGYLEEHKDAYVSGEQLAELFGVSRAAVWKAIKRLQEEGHEITAVTGTGLSAQRRQRYFVIGRDRAVISDTETRIQTIVRQRGGFHK